MDNKISQSQIQFTANTVLTAEQLNGIITKLNEVIGNSNDSTVGSLYSVWTQIDSILTDIHDLQYPENPSEGRENGLEDEEETQQIDIETELKTYGWLDSNGDPIITSQQVAAIGTNTSNITSLQNDKVDKTGVIAAINASQEQLTIDSSKLPVISASSNIIVYTTDNTSATNTVNSSITFPHPQEGLVAIIIHKQLISFQLHSYDNTDSFYTGKTDAEIPCIFPMRDKVYPTPSEISSAGRFAFRVFIGNYDPTDGDRIFWSPSCEMWVCDGLDWWCITNRGTNSSLA